MQMELTFSHKLVLYSLHSHDPYLERNDHPSSLWIIYLIDGLGCTKMVKILAIPKCNSQVMNLVILWGHKISYYKVVILDKIFPMPCCTPQSKVIWSMFLGFNCQESNCEFEVIFHKHT